MHFYAAHLALFPMMAKTAETITFLGEVVGDNIPARFSPSWVFTKTKAYTGVK
jgi:hypothetical protein